MKTLSPVALIAAFVTALLLTAALGLGGAAWWAARTPKPSAAKAVNAAVVTTRELFRDDETLAVEVTITVPQESRVRLTQTPDEPNTGSGVRASSGTSPDAPCVVRLFLLAAFDKGGDRRKRRLIVSLRSEVGGSSSTSRGGAGDDKTIDDLLTVPLAAGTYPLGQPVAAVEREGTLYYLVVDPPGRR